MKTEKVTAEERVAHTPTPWKVEPEIYGIDIVSGDDICIAEVPGLGRHDEQFEVKNWHQANAAFIVTACNAHEALVDALRAAIAKMEKVEQWLQSNATTLEDMAKLSRFQTLADAQLADAKNYRATAASIRKDIDTCRAALSLATEGK